MEFPGITAGGGFAGTSGESSSFRYGFFDRTVNWIEIVLANGDVVTASSTDKSDLFHGAASSFGTLGVTTLLELQLIEAKTYVELTYHPVSGVPEAIQKIEEATKDPSIDYLDGILFARDRGVICTGRLTNVLRDGVRTQRFSRARDPVVLPPCEEDNQQSYLPNNRSNSVSRLPFSIRSRRILGRHLRLQVFHDAFQSYHTLGPRQIHAHTCDVSCAPQKRSFQAIYHSGCRRAISCG